MKFVPTIQWQIYHRYFITDFIIADKFISDSVEPSRKLGENWRTTRTFKVHVYLERTIWRKNLLWLCLGLYLCLCSQIHMQSIGLHVTSV